MRYTNHRKKKNTFECSIGTTKILHETNYIFLTLLLNLFFANCTVDIVKP